MNLISHGPYCLRVKLFNLKCSCDHNLPLIELNSCHCFIIQRVTELKYLSVVINHVKDLILYTRSGLQSLYFLRKFCSPTFKTIYQGIKHSKLQYELTCWRSACYNYNLQRGQGS